ncbi:hypothetical protein RclHR1_03470009 [Rhizophagus clarus]|uniref:Uncharacterized protein n=1 Tax=Rhizophagus clarus TaxID=94130 RepID=A0A2Z6RM54_9GLOM|nr:hypothetical protein RclHR1_03470009 [Rhizophagus clarus]
MVSSNLSFDEYVDDDVDDDDDDVDDNDLDDDDDLFLLDDSITFDKDANDNPYIFQGENISELFISYRSKVLQIARETGLSIATDYREVLSMSQILLLQAANFSDLQVQEFFRNTLEQLQKNMLLPHQTVLDEDLGLKEAKKSLIRSFTKSFENPVDQEKFDRMQIVFFAINGKYTD